MIIRREKNKNYSVISNECFKNISISARAKGVYAYVMTLPNDWKLSKKELYKHFAEGEKALDTAFNELKEKGYVEVKMDKKANGHFAGSEYIFYEFSTNNTNNSETEKTSKTETPISAYAENGISVNGDLLKTNKKQNIKRKLNTKLPKNTVVEESPQVKDEESVQSVSPSYSFFLEETEQSVEARNNQTQEDLISLGLSISQIKALFRVYKISVLCEAVIATFQAQYEMRIDTTQAQYFYGSLKNIESKQSGDGHE